MSPRLLSALVLILSALHTGQAQPADKDLDRLSHFMAGSFKSAEQAATDTAYFDISLHMTPIWIHRTDGKQVWGAVNGGYIFKRVD